MFGKCACGTKPNFCFIALKPLKNTSQNFWNKYSKLVSVRKKGDNELLQQYVKRKRRAKHL